MKNNLFKNLLIILLIVIAQQANSQWLVPDYIRNYDSDQPTVYSEDIAGGYHSVSNLAARDAIPEAKREIGICVTHIAGGLYYTYRFEGINTLDATWENTANWTLIIDEDIKIDSSLISDTALFSFKSDSSNVADTALFALNRSVDSLLASSTDTINLILDTLSGTDVSSKWKYIYAPTMRANTAFYAGTTNTKYLADNGLYLFQTVPSYNRFFQANITSGSDSYLTTKLWNIANTFETDFNVYPTYFDYHCTGPDYDNRIYSDVSTGTMLIQSYMAAAPYTKSLFFGAEDASTYLNYYGADTTQFIQTEDQFDLSFNSTNKYQFTEDSVNASTVDIWSQHNYADSTTTTYLNSEKHLTDTIILNDGNDTVTSTTRIVDWHPDSLIFNPVTKTSHTEGSLVYNSAKQTLSFQNDESETTLDIGEEFRRRVYNNTGSTIENGRWVRRTGTHINTTRVPTIALAGCSTLDSAQVYGMTTHSIEPSTYGWATRAGNVEYLTTTGLTENKGYLGFAGSTFDTALYPPYLSVPVCEVIYADNDSGIVDVDLGQIGFSKTPTFSANFYDSTILVDVVTQNVYQLITNDYNNAFNVINEIGVHYAGDSAQVLVGGQWNIAYSHSFSGTVSADTWKEGIFVNGILRYNSERYTSSTSTGNISGIVGLNLNANDWVSFRMINTTSARDFTMKNHTISLIFLHD